MKRVVITALLVGLIALFAFYKLPETDKYYDNIELALANAELPIDKSDEYQREITHEIHRFENDNYVTVCYISVRDEVESCLSVTKFEKKHIGDTVQYKYIARNAETVRTDTFKGNDGLDLVKANLQAVQMHQVLNIDPDNTVFMFGVNGDKDIYNLKIDGQSPDGVEPFTMLGEERYFWYYENLTTKNPVKDMTVTMD